MKKIFVLLIVSVFLTGCSGFITLNTNLPLNTSKITVINNTNSDLYLLIDGKLKNGFIPPAGVKTFGFWVGGGTNSSQIRVSVSIMDPKRNRSWSEVVSLSSYYKYSYVFTVTSDRENLRVEYRY
jgi:hypothetical protein